MKRSLKKRSAEFKFRVVVESIQKNEVAKVALSYGVHPNQLTKWRREFLHRGMSVFELRMGKGAKQFQERITQLEGLIGKKEIELSVLRNCLGFWAPPDGC